MRSFLVFLFTLSCMSLAHAEQTPLIAHETKLLSLEKYEHSGRTDKNGCHRDRKKGTRHCH